ncbi:MAG: isoprenylcysteine carboxylmethyltransferase family protein [Verrucomicrobiota bacterium]
MNLPGPQYLGLAYFLSELLLSVTRRSRGDGVRQDRSTLRVLWLVIMVSVAVGVYVSMHLPAGALSHRNFWRALGVGLFVGGIALRWWAIVTLGRFFTVDVQIAKNHELVERGPFRLIRHPSYTGVLLAFVGFALSLVNWIAFLVIVLPIFVAFILRMSVEEQALTNALGSSYADYMRRTRRLVPGVY